MEVFKNLLDFEKFEQKILKILPVQLIEQGSAWQFDNSKLRTRQMFVLFVKSFVVKYLNDSFWIFHEFWPKPKVWRLRN